MDNDLQCIAQYIDGGAVDWADRPVQPPTDIEIATFVRTRRAQQQKYRVEHFIHQHPDYAQIKDGHLFFAAFKARQLWELYKDCELFDNEGRAANVKALTEALNIMFAPAGVEALFKLFETLDQQSFD
jgi:hypothetical protein